MDDRNTIIGIDLGTTNSVVAVMEGDAPKIIPNLEGLRLTPSCVAFPASGEHLVGDMARRQAILNPRRTVYSIKRFMGRRLREVREEEKLVSYELVGGPRGFAKVRIGDREYTPPEISAFVIQKLKAAAEAYVRRPVSRAVITVPAYFNDAQRQATKQAGEIAGLQVERIVNEPTAAALAYGLDKKGTHKFAVVDFGGGTFDVSVLELNEGVFRVLGTSGDTRLGGDDFDKALLNHVADAFDRERGIDLRQDPQALQRLLEACELAKRELSTVAVTEIVLPFITANQLGAQHLQARIHRSQFEQLIAPLVERCCQPILKVLADTDLEPADLDDVILVGGSTRVPRVLEMIRQMFNREPNRTVDPEAAVAAGAAIQADILSGRPKRAKELSVLDVIPLSLGIETRGGFMAKLIERNTTLPTRQTEVFSTSEDNQSIVIFRVYQGEHEIAARNRLLDEFCLEGVRPAPQGVPQVRVTFDVDANSILHVSAEDLESGQKQTVRITVAGSPVEEPPADRPAPGPDGDPSKPESIPGELRQHAESMCDTLQDMVDHQAEGVPEELRTAVRTLIAHTRNLAAGDSAAVLRAGLVELGRAGRDLTDAVARARGWQKPAAEASGAGPAESAPKTPPGSTPPNAAPADEIIDVEFQVKQP